MALPKLEGLIDITAAWTAFVDEGGGTSAAVTVAGTGSYYWNSHTTTTSSLCSTIGAALTANPTLALTYTFALDDDADTSNGLVHITHPAPLAEFTFTWTGGSPDPATVCGMLTTDTGYQVDGTSQATYLWLATCGRAPGLLSPDGDEGTDEDDFTLVRAPSGRCLPLRMGSGRSVDWLGFGNIKGSRAWISLETTVNASLQKFHRDVFREGHPFRYYKDRSSDTAYVTWVAQAGGRFQCQPVIPDWWGANALFGWGSEVYKYVAV